MPAECSRVQAVVTCTFTSDASFTVPDTAASLHVVAEAGDGAASHHVVDGTTVSAPGGSGARVAADFATTPGSLMAVGTVVSVTVGTDAVAHEGGAGGGGGGGDGHVTAEGSPVEAAVPPP